MAFVVEDGTGLPNANSLVSVEDADAYHADRSNDAWSALAEDKKQSALIRATDFICRRYVGKWKSAVLALGQGLPFPRADYLDVPLYLKWAVCDVALAASKRPLYSTEPLQVGAVIEDTVGPITTKYAPLSAAELRGTAQFDFLDDMLAEFLATGSTGRLNFTVGRA